MDTRFLPCKLTDTEIRERGEKLASLRNQLADIEASRKGAMANFKAQLERLTKIADDITEEISSKSQYRDIEITEDKDFDAKKAYTIRLDTHAVIETRALTPQELQQGLVFDKPFTNTEAVSAAAAHINAGVLDSEGVTVKAFVR